MPMAIQVTPDEKEAIDRVSANPFSLQFCCLRVQMFSDYRLCANKAEDLINERKIDFACASK